LDNRTTSATVQSVQAERGRMVRTGVTMLGRRLFSEALSPIGT
jgi:hypothetical protein